MMAAARQDPQVAGQPESARLHMRHAGRKNGQLLAPRRQLEAVGIGAHPASSAIEDTASCGLVLMKRGGGRRPNLYALSWLPPFDGAIADRPRSAGRRTPFLRKHLGYPKGRHDLPGQGQHQ
jgi:hypothetical protein